MSQVHGGIFPALLLLKCVYGEFFCMRVVDVATQSRKCIHGRNSIRTLALENQTFANMRVPVAHNARPPLMLGRVMIGKLFGAAPAVVPSLQLYVRTTYLACGM